MKKLTKESTVSFLNDVNHFNGANVNHIHINLTSENTSVCPSFSIAIEVQLECSNRTVRIEMREVLTYRISDVIGTSFFGLAGYPESLLIYWRKESVIISLGESLNDHYTYDDLIKSACFIESRLMFVSNNEIT